MPQVQPAQAPAPIRVRVNVVEVRVVVRDEHGKPVANLSREDFHLYDDGKPQTIANFTVETPEVRSAEAAAAPSAGPTEELMPTDRCGASSWPWCLTGHIFRSRT